MTQEPTHPLGDALAGIRVLEWGTTTAVQYAARLLADFGAEVTCISNLAGSDVQRDASAETRAFFDNGKLHEVVDVASDQGRVDFLTRLASCDILIDDHSPAERARLRLEHPVLAQEAMHLVQVSVTPFGCSGPYRDYRATDLEIAFLSGLSYLTPRDIAMGDPGATPPLKMPGSLVSMYAGASAAGAALTALHARDNGQRAATVDVSMLESLIPTLRRELALVQYEDRIASRFMRVWRLAPWGVKRCADGHVFLQVVEKHHWQGLVDMMGTPAWAVDERYLEADFRFEHRVEIESSMAPWLLQQTKSSFAWESQRRGLPFAPVNDVADLAHIPQLHVRRFFRSVKANDGRPCVVPGSPYAFRILECREGPVATRARAASGTARQGPLRDLRVVDFGHVWAGPYCAALLADMGAEVIKVESLQRLDVHRRQGPYPDGRPGMNRSGVWNAQNRGKRSVTLNLATERGVVLACALVATADVVIENFAPGVMQRLGLDYPSLARQNPGLVMASLSAFGQEGPQRSYVGYGPSLDAWSGLDALTAYPGGEPNALGGIFPDTGSALHAAVAILAALRRRDRTGAGCYIDVSELEVSILLLASEVCREFGGETVDATGNRDDAHCPRGAYRCAGEDEWLALSVIDHASWKALCEVLGRDDWARDETLASPAGRQARSQDIDTAIAGWMRSHRRHDAMVALQARGVPAGEAHDARSLLADPHLAARGFFTTLKHPEVGDYRTYAPIWRVDGSMSNPAAAGPALGADNDYVLRHILKLPADEIESLLTARIVY